jgi:uncharacterized SAM-binding protein YcdF (DUF218 family)
MHAPAHRRRGRRLWVRRTIAAGALAVMVGLVYLAVTAGQVMWASGHDDDPARADAIVVLGAAQFDGRPSTVLRQRLDHAAALYFEGRAPTIVVTGGNQPGDRTTEGLAGFVYLREAGVPEEALLVEVDSHNTYEQLSATRLILADRGLRTAILVSDPYHNLRLRGIADEVGLDADVSSTQSHMSTYDVTRETVAVGIGRVVGYRRLTAHL